MPACTRLRYYRGYISANRAGPLPIIKSPPIGPQTNKRGRVKKINEEGEVVKLFAR